MRNEIEKSIADYSEAIRLSPTIGKAYDKRANAWNKQRDFDAAKKDWVEAIRLDANDSSFLNNLARLCATCPQENYRDGERAVELATKACELSEWKVCNHIGTLAAASAEVGDWENAAKLQEQAIQMATNETDKRVDRERLELYKQHVPYRE